MLSTSKEYLPISALWHVHRNFLYAFTAIAGLKKEIGFHFEQAAFKFSLPLASLSLVEGQLALTFFYWESRKGKTACPCQLDETYSQPVKQLLFMFLCGRPLTTWNCYMPITKLPAICRLQ